jgi:hypothetical protein
MKKKDFPMQNRWLGWAPDSFIPPLPAGKYWEGIIYDSSPFDPKRIVSTIKTTRAQDEEFLKYMKGRSGTRDRYTVLNLNCVNYTNQVMVQVQAGFLAYASG